jgi:hypothetical protein
MDFGGGLERIKAAFDETFESWSIQLPVADLEARRGGMLRQEGGSGSVRYAFGRSDRGEYLEFYVFDRVWGDLHQRIYASGEVEHLRELETTFMQSDDPEEMKRQREEQEERNRQLLEDLDRAGLRKGGPVPTSFEINAYLVTGDRNPEEPDD